MSDQSNAGSDMSAEENQAGGDDIEIPTSSQSTDDLPANGEPAIPSGSSGSSGSMQNYDTGECAICMSPHVEKSRLNCGHVFCFNCLAEWCRVKLQCPTCRQPFANFVHQTAPTAQEEVYTPDPPPVPRNPVIVIRVLLNNQAPDGAPVLIDEVFRQFMEILFNPNLQPGNANQPNPNDPSGNQD